MKKQFGKLLEKSSLRYPDKNEEQEYKFLRIPVLTHYFGVILFPSSILSIILFGTILLNYF